MRKLFITCTMFAIPVITLAQELNCHLPYCTISTFVDGKSNVVVNTSNIVVNRRYRCQVRRGEGHFFSLKDIRPSEGVIVLSSLRLNIPFTIQGAITGHMPGRATFTVHNNNYRYETNYLNYRCFLVPPEIK